FDARETTFVNGDAVEPHRWIASDNFRHHGLELTRGSQLIELLEPLSLRSTRPSFTQLGLHLIDLLAKLLVFGSGPTQFAQVAEQTADPIHRAGRAPLHGIHDRLRD